MQDDWRVRSNLTSTWACEYEFFQPFTEKYRPDRQPRHRARIHRSGGGGAGRRAGPYWASPERAGRIRTRACSRPRGPRWQPFPQPAPGARGYGIYYNGSIYNQFPSRLAAQPPLPSSASLMTSLANRSRSRTASPPHPPKLSPTPTPWTAITGRIRADLECGDPAEPAARGGGGGRDTSRHKGTRPGHPALPNRAAPGSPLTAEQRRQIGNAIGFHARHLERQLDLSRHAGARDAAFPEAGSR